MTEKTYTMTELVNNFRHAYDANKKDADRVRLDDVTLGWAYAALLGYLADGLHRGIEKSVEADLTHAGLLDE